MAGRLASPRISLSDVTILQPLARLRTPAIALIVGSLVFAMAGCSPDEPQPAASASATPAPSPSFSSTYVTPDPTAIAPLTGVTVPAGSLANPALSAKIDNHEAARPQIGLNQADLVFEILVEGGLTRYLAVWQSDIPKLIGPVRSIRPVDPQIASAFGGIIAYSGGQQMFVDKMLNTPVFNAIHGQASTDSVFYRADDRSAPHDVILRAQDLVAQHADLAAPPVQFAFSLDGPSSTAAKDGEPTGRITDVMSDIRTVAWEWNEKSGTWLRSTRDGKDLDASGKQLHATNVISMVVDTDWRYGYIPWPTVVGKGTAFVSSEGKSIKATWSKKSAEAPIRLVDGQGATVRLAPGNSWIQLVPNGSGSVSLTPPTS